MDHRLIRVEFPPTQGIGAALRLAYQSLPVKDECCDFAALLAKLN